MDYRSPQQGQGSMHPHTYQWNCGGNRSAASGSSGCTPTFGDPIWWTHDTPIGWAGETSPSSRGDWGCLVWTQSPCHTCTGVRSFWLNSIPARYGGVHSQGPGGLTRLGCKDFSTHHCQRVYTYRTRCLRRALRTIKASSAQHTHCSLCCHLAGDTEASELALADWRTVPIEGTSTFSANSDSFYLVVAYNFDLCT